MEGLMSTVEARARTAISAVQTARTLDELNEAMAAFAQSLGCSHYLLAPGPDNPSDDPHAWLACGNFPTGTTDLYRSNTLCLADPARRLALTRGGQVVWRKAWGDVRDGQARAFITQLRTNGLRDGITTAVHGPQGCVALLMLATSDTLRPSQDDDETITLIALAAHQRMRRLEAASVLAPASNIALTERERECLQWVLEGKTNWEIGVLTGVAARTVQFHLANAQRKLGAGNRTQAGVQALIRGLIPPPGTALPPPDAEPRAA
jgi:DNA-binding CsgD family transcriptional regulator